MALTIKPVKVNRSVYIRVPNDIADLIELTKTDQFNLRLEGTNEDVRLIYSRHKSPITKIDNRVARPIIARVRALESR